MLIVLSGIATLLLYMRRTQPAANDLMDISLPDNEQNKTE
jgi:hypothetical protein